LQRRNQHRRWGPCTFYDARDSVKDAECVKVVEEDLNVLKTGLCRIVCAESCVGLELPILSAISGSRPFSSVISLLTSSHGDLSSLSTADEMVLSLSVGTPHTEKIPSRILRWLSLIVYLPFQPSSSKISHAILRISASGIMGTRACGPWSWQAGRDGRPLRCGSA
ncbi:hypothetical protein KCU98_g96, partial [Aureobasidium melanogenum]